MRHMHINRAPNLTHTHTHSHSHSCSVNGNATQHPPMSYQTHINIKIVLHSHGWIFKWVWLFIREQSEHWTVSTEHVKWEVTDVAIELSISFNCENYVCQWLNTKCMQRAKRVWSIDFRRCNQYRCAFSCITNHDAFSHRWWSYFVSDASNVNYSVFFLLFIIGLEFGLHTIIVSQKRNLRRESFLYEYFRKKPVCNENRIEGASMIAVIKLKYLFFIAVPLRIFFHSIELLKMQF